MYQIRLERGEKRTCLSCEAKFYDMLRVPATCPKCGAEFVEVVRPAAPAYQRRGRMQFGANRARPIEADEEIAPISEVREADDDEAEAEEEDDREPEADEAEEAEE